MDRTTATNELTCLKVADNDKYCFQKRDNSGNGITGSPVSTSAINTNAFEILNYRRARDLITPANSTYDLFLNGVLERTTVDTDGDLTPPVPRIGRHATIANNGLNGFIAEVMAFDFDLNTTQLNIVNSYLSAKYNISVTGNKYSFAFTHSNDVAGIGMESATDMHLSAQSASLLQVGSASDLNAGEYLLFGHDGGDATAWSGTNSPDRVQRLTRVWRFNETGGDLGTIKFTVDSDNLPAFSTNYTKYAVLVDADGDFSNGAMVYELESEGANNFYQSADINIADGDYVTVAEIRPTVQFVSAASAGIESLDLMTDIELNFIPKNDVQVRYTLFEEGAVANEDYTHAREFVTIPAGSTSYQIDVDIENDGFVESDEQFKDIMCNDDNFLIKFSSKTTGRVNTVHKQLKFMGKE